MEENTRKGTSRLPDGTLCAPLATPGGGTAGIAFQAGAIPHQRKIAARAAGVAYVALEPRDLRLLRAAVRCPPSGSGLNRLDRAGPAAWRSPSWGLNGADRSTPCRQPEVAPNAPAR